MALADLLARRLADARRHAGLSQEDVADATGLPRSAVSDIETGRRTIAAIELAALAGLYRIDLADLFDPGGDLPDPTPDLRRVWPTLSRADQHAVLRHARRLAP